MPINWSWGTGAKKSVTDEVYEAAPQLLLMLVIIGPGGEKRNSEPVAVSDPQSTGLSKLTTSLSRLHGS